MMFIRCTVILALAAMTGAAQLQTRVFILIGPPGSGKSVQANLLSKTYKIPAISMATVLKESMVKNTNLTKGLQGQMASGELVGDDAANDAMKTRLLRKDTGKGFVLDGYPTSRKQAEALDAYLADQSFPKPIVVILEVPDDVQRQRMKARKRVDDTPENIDRRIREYRDLGAAAEKWYGTGNTVRVDGTGTIQNVALAINQQIDNVRAKKGFAVRPQGEGGLKKRDPAETPAETPAPTKEP